MLSSVAVSPSTVRIVSWASILLSRAPTDMSYLSAGPPGTTPATQEQMTRLMSQVISGD